MKLLFGPILRAFDTLTKEGFSQVDDPKNIVFLEADTKKKCPKVLMQSATTRPEDNFKQLRKLLLTLMGNREIPQLSHAVTSFLWFLNWNASDFNVLYNHPALWSPESSGRFAIQAQAYIRKNYYEIHYDMEQMVRTEPTFVEFEGWQNRLNKDLKLFLQESLKHKTKNYESNLIGLIEFQRDAHVHYNDKGHSNIEDYQTNAQLEKMFVKLFPNILSAGYCFMLTFKFRFEE
ncbi:hypothetical protein FRX31_020033 [Thalictrum thalictroides]|uniref:Uncharacterized protein n=1 Tax=Thalictrum thalictroides TaxID=46969 RepID=A0A7J6VZ28_THATH|nr:hypothetical protein FRX31_020033 [Thalictrum thalictroides]